MLNYLRKSKKGFTLIELIVVIAILAILAAIAIPAFVGIQDQATTASYVADAKILAQAINTYNALHPNLATPIGSRTAWEGISWTDELDLRPAGLPTDATELDKVWAKIDFSNGVVIVDEDGEPS